MSRKSTTATTTTTSTTTFSPPAVTSPTFPSPPSYSASSSSSSSSLSSTSPSTPASPALPASPFVLVSPSFSTAPPARTTSAVRETKKGSSVSVRRRSLSPTVSMVERKRAVYIKTLKEEFLRELHHQREVFHKRAKARDTLTQEVLSPINKVSSFASVPIVSSVVSSLAEVGDYVAGKQQKKQIAVLATLQHDLDLPRLEVLIDIVAREAARRYENVIDRLSDRPEGVIAFARVGARRMIEYASRIGKHTDSGDVEEMVINESSLLTGLIEGRSGSGVDEWENTSLHLSATKKDTLGRPVPLKLEAEDVYGRAGFRHIGVVDGKPVTALYTRKEPKQIDRPELKKKTAIAFTGKSRPSGFGYVRYRKSKGHQHDPKVGYVDMPLAVIRDRYDFQSQDAKTLSRELQEELKVFQPSVVCVDKATIAGYLSWHTTLAGANKSLLTYLREVCHYAQVQRAKCSENLTGLTLTGADFNHSDFSGAILSGDLSEVNFSDSYLRGTQFIGVTSAQGLNLNRSHCEFLQAEEVDFSGSDLTQANLAYAHLQKANLMGCKRLDAVFQGADLRDIRSDKDLLSEQKRQQEALADHVTAQSERLAVLTARLEALQTSQSALLKQCRVYAQDQWEAGLERIGQLFETEAKTLQDASLTTWETIQSHWASLAAAFTTQGIDAILPMTDYLTSKQAEATEPTLQTALTRLETAWTALRSALRQSEQTVETVSEQVQRLHHHHQARLTFEAECQRELHALRQRLDTAADAKAVQTLQDRFAEVTAELKGLQSGTAWQTAVQECQTACQAEFKQWGETQSQQLLVLETQLHTHCDRQFTEQGQRLSGLEKDLAELGDQLSQRLQALEQRVDALDTWVKTAQQTFLTQEAEAKDTKGLVKALKAAVEDLQKDRAAQRQQQEKQSLEIAALQQRLVSASEAGGVKQLQKDLKAIQPSVSDISSAPPESVLKALQAIHADLRQQQEAKEAMVKRTPNLPKKVELQIKQLKAQSEQVAALQSQLADDWAAHQATQTALVTALNQQLAELSTNCDQRLKQLETDVSALKAFAEKAQQRLADLESEEGPIHTQLRTLQTQLTAWIKQSADKDSKGIETLSLTEHLKAIQEKYREQQADWQSIAAEGDEDGSAAAAIKDIADKIKILEEMDRGFHTLTVRLDKVEAKVATVEQRAEDTRRRVDENDPRYTLGKRLLLLRRIILDDLKEEKPSVDISSEQFKRGQKFGKGLTEELGYYIAPNGKRTADSSDSTATPLYAWVSEHFLSPSAAPRVLLLQGPGGAGKTTFNRYLLRQLWLDPAWASFKPGDPAPKAWLPFFIPLNSEQVDPKKFFDYLRDLPELIEDFTDAEINLLKKDYRLLWIADGYDEMAGNQKINLYNANGLNQYSGRIKLLIGRRSTPALAEGEEKTYFMPSLESGESLAGYLSFYVAPFNSTQINSYIQQYLDKQVEAPWKTVATYREHFARIQGIEALVSTPFLLRIAVEILPGIIQAVETEHAQRTRGSGTASSTKLELTKKRLLDGFIDHWFTRQAEKANKNKDYLEDPGAILGDDVVDTLRGGTQDFETACLKRAYAAFCMMLASHLQEEERTSVIYPPLATKRKGLGKASTLSTPRLPPSGYLQVVCHREERARSSYQANTLYVRCDDVEAKHLTVNSLYLEKPVSLYPSQRKQLREILSEAGYDWPETTGKPVEINAPEQIRDIVSTCFWAEELLDDRQADMERCRRGSPLRTTSRGPVSVEYGFLHALLIDYFQAVSTTERMEQKAGRTSTAPALTAPALSTTLAGPPALSAPMAPTPSVRDPRPAAPVSGSLQQMVLGSSAAPPAAQIKRQMGSTLPPAPTSPPGLR